LGGSNVAQRAALGIVLFTPLSPAQAPKAASELPKTAPPTAQILSSYEGQNVTAIELAGRPGIRSEQYSQYFAQQVGAPFSREKVDATIAALKSKGQFEQVQLQVLPEANGVRLLMVLEPAVYFGLFEFPGAEQFSYSRLIQLANYPPQAPYNAVEIQRDIDSLLNFFRQQGYFRAVVNPELKVDATHGLADVTLRSINARSLAR
jgi:outer membrane protein assembly factor BamA